MPLKFTPISSMLLKKVRFLICHRVFLLLPFMPFMSPQLVGVAVKPFFLKKKTILPSPYSFSTLLNPHSSLSCPHRHHHHHLLPPSLPVLGRTRLPAAASWHCPSSTLLPPLSTAKEGEENGQKNFSCIS